MFKGTFIADNTMGFEKDKTYELSARIKMISKSSLPYFPKDAPCICVYDENSDAWNYYPTVEQFLAQWKF